MSIKLNSLEQTAETQISSQKLPKNQYIELHQTITKCCVLPKNNKRNPFINFFKTSTKSNSVERLPKPY